MKTRYSFVALNRNPQLFTLLDLLDGEIVPNGARAVPDEVMDISQESCFADHLVEKIVARSF
jgi:hypothetical protein